MSIDLVAEEGLYSKEIKVYRHNEDSEPTSLAVLHSNENIRRNYQIAALVAETYLGNNISYTGPLRVLVTLNKSQVTEAGYERHPGLYIYDRNTGLANLVNDTTARSTSVLKENLQKQG
ncbi:MAG: hypothetical protein KKG75_01985 [Nanoarchaeota archaeon]|nr:hypothetical protein [Nanoarchaeota archaeon]